MSHRTLLAANRRRIGLGLCGIGAALVVGAIAPAASAATTAFSTEAAFIAAAGPLTTQGFESAFVSGTTVTVPGFSMTSSASLFSHNTNVGFTTAGSGSAAITPATSQTITFTFGAAINSFGLNVNDLGDFVGTSALSLTTNAGDALVAFSGTGLANQNILEFGMINGSATFTTVTLTFTGTTGDQFFFDEVRYGLTASAGGGGANGVPLPPAVWAGLASGAMIMVRRLRRA